MRNQKSGVSKLMMKPHFLIGDTLLKKRVSVTSSEQLETGKKPRPINQEEIWENIIDFFKRQAGKNSGKVAKIERFRTSLISDCLSTEDFKTECAQKIDALVNELIGEVLSDKRTELYYFLSQNGFDPSKANPDEKLDLVLDLYLLGKKYFSAQDQLVFAVKEKCVDCPSKLHLPRLGPMKLSLPKPKEGAQPLPPKKTEVLDKGSFNYLKLVNPEVVARKADRFQVNGRPTSLIIYIGKKSDNCRMYTKEGMKRGDGSLGIKGIEYQRRLFKFDPKERGYVSGLYWTLLEMHSEGTGHGDMKYQHVMRDDNDRLHLVDTDSKSTKANWKTQTFPRAQYGPSHASRFLDDLYALAVSLLELKIGKYGNLSHSSKMRVGDDQTVAQSIVDISSGKTAYRSDIDGRVLRRIDDLEKAKAELGLNLTENEGEVLKLALLLGHSNPVEKLREMLSTTDVPDAPSIYLRIQSEIIYLLLAGENQFTLPHINITLSKLYTEASLLSLLETVPEGDRSSWYFLIHKAVGKNWPSICQLLLDWGTSKRMVNEHGQTPLDIARALSYPECEKVLIGQTVE